MVSNEEFDAAVVATGMLMNKLFVESMWTHGIEIGMIDKIVHEVALKLRKIEEEESSVSETLKTRLTR